MKILSVKPQKPPQYRICFDDGRAVLLDASIVYDFGLKEGAELDSDRFRELMRAAVSLKVYNFAVKRLFYRDYSAAEMLDKLSEEFRSKEICRQVVERLVAESIINDERYADRIAYKYIAVKRYGRQRVLRELKSRGIGRFTAEDAVNSYEEKFQENILHLLRTKYARILTDKKDMKAVNRVKSSLARYGYGFAEINRAVNEYFITKDQLEEQ